MTIQFDYAIGDKVIIRDIEMKGTVTGLMVDECGKQYRIVWWNNNERNERTLYPFEIKRYESN